MQELLPMLAKAPLVVAGLAWAIWELISIKREQAKDAEHAKRRGENAES